MPFQYCGETYLTVEEYDEYNKMKKPVPKDWKVESPQMWLVRQVYENIKCKQDGPTNNW